jgi:hypothetical protein
MIVQAKLRQDNLFRPKINVLSLPDPLFAFLTLFLFTLIR